MKSKGVRDLVSRVSRALHEGDLSGAREACERLERADPTDPGLPRQRAEICRLMQDVTGQLSALIRSAELYAESGQVIQAIGACKQILAIDPDHSATQKRLELLYLDGSPTVQAPDALDDGAFGARDDAPLDELQLTEVVPEASPELTLAEPSTEDISRIPLDPGDSLQFEGDAVAAFEMHSKREPEARSPQEELARTPLFGSLDAASMQRVIQTIELVELAEGEVLFRQGDPASSLYIVVEGAVVAIAEGSPRKKLAVLEASEFFGEIGLVTDQPRNATIEALVDTKLLALDRAVIWDLIRSQPSVFKVMLRFLRERLVDRLGRTGSLFSGFSPEERIAVARQFRLLEVRDGAIVIEQDREAPGLFMLLSGSLRVIYMDSDGDKELATLQPQDLFGEISLIRGTPTTAAVVSNGKCWVLCLPAKRFHGLAKRHPELIEALDALATQREQANRAALCDAGGMNRNRLGAD